MKIHDLMRTDVVTVTPSTSLKDAAALLVEHGISGLPVCDDDGNVVGVVSEADILVKEGGTSEREGLLAWALGGDVPAKAAKFQARTVGEAMTTPAITTGPHRLVASAAREMVEHGIKRLPVVGLGGTLLGIVTRADLIRAFVRSDQEIEADIRTETLHGALWLDGADRVDVTVQDGEVWLSGEVESGTDAQLVESLVTKTPGVVAVHSELRPRFADHRVRA
jgi:CBS domain-containing protein